MLVRVAFVAVVAAAAVIATPSAGGSPAPALTLVAAGHPGSSGAVPATDAGQGAAHVGVHGEGNAAQRAEQEAIEKAARRADPNLVGAVARAG